MKGRESLQGRSDLWEGEIGDGRGRQEDEWAVSDCSAGQSSGGGPDLRLPIGRCPHLPGMSLC